MSQYTKKLKRKIEQLRKESRGFCYPSGAEVTLQKQVRDLEDRLRHATYDQREERDFRGKQISDASIYSSPSSPESSVLIRYKTDAIEYREMVPREAIMRGAHPRAQEIKEILMRKEREEESRWNPISMNEGRSTHVGDSAIGDTFPRTMEALQRIALVNGAFPQGIGSDLTETKEKQAINDKAMQLLKEKIGDELFKSLEEKGHFDVKGKQGTYRFFKSDKVELTQMLKLTDNKKRPLIWNLCIESVVCDMPVGDVILGRYLMLKADEAKFLDTANFRSVKTDDEYKGIGALGGMIRDCVNQRVNQAIRDELDTSVNESLTGGGVGRPMGILGVDIS